MERHVFQHINQKPCIHIVFSHKLFVVCNIFSFCPYRSLLVLRCYSNIGVMISLEVSSVTRCFSAYRTWKLGPSSFLIRKHNGENMALDTFRGLVLWC
jgi:hypothetical protein